MNPEFENWMQSLEEGFIAFASDLSIKWINSAGARILETKSNVADLIGKKASNVGAFGSLLENSVKRVLANGIPILIQEHHPGKKNLGIYRIQFSPVKAPDGKISAVSVVLREETSWARQFEDLKNAHERLEAQLRLLNIFDIVAETDIEGTILYANDKFCEISGFTREELLGNTHRIVKSGYHSKEFYRDMWQTLLRGKLWTGEICNRKKNGEHYWVSSVIGPIFDESGKMVRFLALRRDITQQIAAQDELRKSADRYRQLLENVHRVAIGFDRQGAVTFANQELLKLTEWSMEELRAQDWSNLALRSEVEDSPQKEVKIRKKTGEELIIRWTRTPYVDDQGKWAGSTSIGENITEIRAREAQIQKIQQRERKQRDAVISFISHELRSPLMSLRSGLDMIQMNLEERKEFDAQIKKVQQIMYGHIERIDSISRDLLNSVFYDESSLECHPRLMDMAALIRKIGNRLAEEVSRRNGLALNLQVPDLPLMGEWDEARLEQALSNIVINAIRYSKPTGGTILLKLCEENNEVVIRVSDTGIGIPADYLDRIFEMFSRAENVVSLGVRGFGLGLKISKDIIEKHAGKVSVESALGSGSVFTVRLPLK
jgi:PAS domain S-box-containing protein